jgi:hypothetical protein
MSTGKSTYWPPDPNKLPDLTDFFVLKNISAKDIQIDEGNDLNSDHSPILLTINKQTPWPLVRNRTIPTERPPLVGET